MKIIGAPSGDHVARAAARVFVDLAADAIERRGTFVWAVSGGSTPRRFLDQLAKSDRIDWPRIQLFQVDERVAPDGTETRNDTMIREHLADLSPIGNYAPMPVVTDDLPREASAYQVAIEEAAGQPAVLDLVQLGLGADGHTASLVPDDSSLDTVDRDIDLTGPYAGARRMTMTYPLINRARHRLWIVTGAAKRSVLTQMIGRDPTLPASQVTTVETTLITDAFAASKPT